MRKVLAKNPMVEQQRLHRRVFLENVIPENQALSVRLQYLSLLLHPSSDISGSFGRSGSYIWFSFLQILISCFVKTSHHEEYLGVKVIFQSFILSST